MIGAAGLSYAVRSLNKHSVNGTALAKCGSSFPSRVKLIISISEGIIIPQKETDLVSLLHVRTTKERTSAAGL